MRIERKSLAIALWSVCGILLLAVVALAIALYLRRHVRFANRRRAQQSGGARCGFAGYRRGNQLELSTSPDPGTYDDAQVVHIYMDHTKSKTDNYYAAHVHERTQLAPPLPRAPTPTADRWVSDAGCDILIRISFLPLSSEADRLVTGCEDDTCYLDDRFLLYTAPLHLVDAGTYVIHAYTVRPAERIVGAVHRFVFVRLAPPPADAVVPVGLNDLSSAPLPPHIIPDFGDITTDTPITITPHPHSTTADQIRYSVDGTHPTLLYHGPFTLALPPTSVLPEQHMIVRVRAMALTGGAEAQKCTALWCDASRANVTHSAGTHNYSLGSEWDNSNNNKNETDNNVPIDGACHNHNNINNNTNNNHNNTNNNENDNNNTSKFSSHVGGSCRVLCPHSSSLVTEATLHLYPASYSFYDSRIPAPSIRVHALHAELYFDESRNPAGTQTVYRLLTVDAARRRVKFGAGRVVPYTGKSIAVVEDIALIYAWTVVCAPGGGARQGAHGDADSRHNPAGLVHSETDDDEEEDDYSRREDSSRGVHGAGGSESRSRSCSGGAERGRGGDADRPARWLRSPATVYDCLLGAVRHAKPNAKRVAAAASAHGGMSTGDGVPLRFLPPPIPCVSCKEMDVEFDAAAGDGMIVYTLNNTEPVLYSVYPPASAAPLGLDRSTNNNNNNNSSSSSSSSSRNCGRDPPQGHLDHNKRNTNTDSRLDRAREHTHTDAHGGAASTVPADVGGLHTHIYRPGTRIRVTLLETAQVYLTARVFVPVYGDVDGGRAGGGYNAPGDAGARGGRLRSYRLGNLFRRGFFLTCDAASG